MKVFVFSTHILWPSHFETELELMQEHLEKGDEVFHFVCNGELSICDVNPDHSLLKCLQCRDMRVRGQNLLEGKIKELPIIHRNKLVREKANTYFFKYNSIEELQKIRVDDFDLGYAAVSSVVSLLREPNPDIQKNKDLFDRFLYSSLSVYFSTIQYINELNPEQVYVFNGRFAHVNPVLKASIARNINCFVHERGGDKDHYSLFKNTTPHDRAYIVNMMQEKWENADPIERKQIGQLFYEERLEGKDQGWYSFTSNQQKGTLPDNWNKAKRNIAIFNSSEDEFASIGPDWKNDLYNTQLDGIRQIMSDCINDVDIHFYLRIHPNLANIDNSEMEGIRKLNFPNLTIIDPISPVSTYDLLFNCEKIIAFGSTVGIEAVYWNKPSIQAGKSYYYGLNATYKPSSHFELVDMIKEILRPMDRTPALMYGYYFKTLGIPYKYYHATGLFNGTFKGVDVSQGELPATKKFKKLRQKKVIRFFANYLENRFSHKRMKIPWLM